MCCGCANGQVLTKLLLPSLAKLLEGNFNSGFLQRVRSHHNVVDEDRIIQDDSHIKIKHI